MLKVSQYSSTRLQQLHRYYSTIVLLVVLSFFSHVAVSLAQSQNDYPSGHLAGGDYVPGTVLVYRYGKWYSTATEGAVDPKQNTYVIIPGAHSKIKSVQTNKIAQTIAAHNNKANILVLDWSYWSNLGASEIEQTITEAVTNYFAESLVTNLATDVFNYMAGTNLEVDNDEILQRHFQRLIGIIMQKVVPIDQAKYIPQVATRLNWKLFGSQGETKTFVTRDRDSRSNVNVDFIALGLDPKKTSLIGHSHGAHIAGLTGVYSQASGAGTIKAIYALDPSTHLCHQYNENDQGNGWNRTAAKTVFVLKTSYIFCSDKLYGTLNVFLSNPQHPLMTLAEPTANDFSNNKAYVLEWLLKVFTTEFTEHSRVVDDFIHFVESVKLLDREYPDNEDDANKWATFERED